MVISADYSIIKINFINSLYNNLKNENKMKSQAFSMDIMIAIVVFIGVIFVIYSVFTSDQKSSAEDLEKDASKVLGNIASEDPDVGIVTDIEVDEAKLEQLLGKDYSIIKEQIRAEKDFCIFLEDENGDIIYISPGQPGIGSNKIRISDVPCS